MTAESKPAVGLFATCLADLFRPTVAFAAARLLRAAGCTVTVPLAQTCCGQPAYNSGDAHSARCIAKRVVEVFSPYDFTVAPSGSCAAMIREHYPALLGDDPGLREKSQTLARRTYELTSFLADVRDFTAVDAAFNCAVTYHDSCAGLRECGIRRQPRRLLQQVRGLTLREMADSNVCCGFGGTFCVKYPDISARMAGDKAHAVAQSGADAVLGGDLGCLLNIAGCIKRSGGGARVFHVAEVLAGLAGAAIGEGEGEGEGGGAK